MTGTVDFLHDTRWEDLPADARRHARLRLLDLLAVAAAGSTTSLSRITRDHAHRHMPSPDGPRLLFDGRRASPPGAALANAATIDSVDGHDGHRLTKGHAGAAILPAALALLDNGADHDLRDLLAALVVGYEVATRAGIALHTSAREYHSSGAWNAIGAAAVAARALRLDSVSTQHALGIAEYAAPRAAMMRAIAHPTMVKDSSAWGAHAGVSAALLAADGFTGSPAELLDHMPEVWDDLGSRWRVLEQYTKFHPVCRWAHPAIEAALALRQRHTIAPESIRDIEVRTFKAATQLTTRIPASTEEAQYSLPFPVAMACVHGELPITLVTAPERANAQLRRIARDLRVIESPELTAAFPRERSATVTITLTSGRRLTANRAASWGDPEQPLTDTDLDVKLRSYALPILGEARTARLDRMLAPVEDAANVDLGDMLTEIVMPASR
ncbi:MAG: MmgE/PrpD family protein [Actinophytocola sp.]|nr:MmgE/PrpD family protein [Actinophytocola sp.]